MLLVLGLLIFKSVNIRFDARSLVARTVQGARHFDDVVEGLKPLKIFGLWNAVVVREFVHSKICSALFWVS